MFTEKSGQARVQLQALGRYVKTQFGEYNPPPLQQFLVIKKGNNEVRPFTFSADPHSQLSKDVAELLENEAILYVQSGCVELHRKEGRHWKREIQYKEGSFFTLLNYRNIAIPEPEWYKLVFKAKVVISVMPIRSNYCFEWMRSVWYKNSLLSKIFFYNDPEIDIEKKKHRFQEFADKFKQETFRRDTRIVNEGKKNEKLYIIAKGEARLIKQLSAQVKAKAEISKSVEILYLREGAIFGGQLFLIGSKAIHTIISNHSSPNREGLQSKLSIKEEENEQSQGEEERRGRKKGRSRLSKVSVEAGGYALYDPHENISNFTVQAESANLQLYYMQLDSLVNSISERSKINFLKLLESTYITILRRTHEKMSLELRKEQDRVSSNNSKIEVIAAKAYSALDSQTQVIASTQHMGISMKISEIGIGKDTISQFKNQQVRKAQDNHIEKRTDLLTKEKRPPIDFKQKIEALIENKLNKREEGNVERIIDDLGDIFMKKNEGRSEDIEKRADFLERKRAILERRGGWRQGWDQLKEEGVKMVKRKESVEKVNYLNGLRVEDYATNIMERCNHKIHETNKIKEQFMKIKSECPSCSCYDNFQNFSTERRSMTCLGRTGTKTAQGWGKTSKVKMQEESLEQVYHRMTFLSEKAKQKYNHNIHLLQVRRNRSQLQRRRSAPKL